jgi:hypothetical protein
MLASIPQASSLDNTRSGQFIRCSSRHQIPLRICAPVYLQQIVMPGTRASQSFVFLCYKRPSELRVFVAKTQVEKIPEPKHTFGQCLFTKFSANLFFFVMLN